MGINAAQLDGDDHAGYNKVGIVAGIRGTVSFAEKYDLSIELLYSQKGSVNELIFRSTDPPIPASINLAYAEIPIFFNYKDWLSSDETYYQMEFNFGLSYARLLSVDVEAFPYVPESFKDFDINFLAGVTFFTGPHLGIGARYERSFLLIYKGDETQGLGALNGHHLTFQLLYML